MDVDGLPELGELLGDGGDLLGLGALLGDGDMMLGGEEGEDELLVRAESRVRELVEQADLETLTARLVLQEIKTEFGDDFYAYERLFFSFSLMI